MDKENKKCKKKPFFNNENHTRRTSKLSPFVGHEYTSDKSDAKQEDEVVVAG